MIFTVARATAEDLVLPYSCAVNGSAIRLMPSSDNTYRIIGRREEQPFAACAKGGGACETMMVHRFSVACDGSTVSWQRIAQAASANGVAILAGLPDGYAPVTMLSGRFVLPALTRTETHLATPVATQNLSPDSVIEGLEDHASQDANQWVTEVRADVLRAAPGSGAGQVAASIGVVLLMLFSASMVAAGRWRWPTIQLASLTLSPANFGVSMVHLLQKAVARLRSGSLALVRAWKRLAEPVPGEQSDHSVLLLNARLIEVELEIAALPTNLLLRDVLHSEIDTLRRRIADTERQMTRWAPQKSAAVVRRLMRELDRIGRIVHSAAHRPTEPGQEPPASTSMPQSMSDAYRILGINPDAAPLVAKKLVDALRMSWHPDHARDELDRLRREDRMKQINAAWDLI